LLHKEPLGEEGFREESNTHAIKRLGKRKKKCKEERIQGIN